MFAIVVFYKDYSTSMRLKALKERWQSAYQSKNVFAKLELMDDYKKIILDRSENIRLRKMALIDSLGTFRISPEGIDDANKSSWTDAYIFTLNNCSDFGPTLGCARVLQYLYLADYNDPKLDSWYYEKMKDESLPATDRSWLVLNLTKYVGLTERNRQIIQKFAKDDVNWIPLELASLVKTHEEAIFILDLYAHPSCDPFVYKSGFCNSFKQYMGNVPPSSDVKKLYADVVLTKSCNNVDYIANHYEYYGLFTGNVSGIMVACFKKNLITNSAQRVIWLDWAAQRFVKNRATMGWDSNFREQISPYLTGDEKTKYLNSF